MWCPATGGTSRSNGRGELICTRARPHSALCVCARACVCVCVRVAVSTARIGMSGMIGIEFFKNAFSPGAPAVCSVCDGGRDRGPVALADRRATCRQTRARAPHTFLYGADRVEVTHTHNRPATAVARARTEIRSPPPSFAYLVILLALLATRGRGIVRSSVVAYAREKQTRFFSFVHGKIGTGLVKFPYAVCLLSCFAVTANYLPPRNEQKKTVLFSGTRLPRGGG